MSTTAKLRRGAPKPFDGKRAGLRGPSGRPLCRWCGTEVAPRRQSWCSDACVQQYLDTTPERLRTLTLARDGRCVLCGFVPDEYHGPLPPGSQWKERAGMTGGRLSQHHWREVVKLEADHIVPLAEGGQNHVDNMRALCRTCHRRQTAALAGRLAARRRATGGTDAG